MDRRALMGLSLLILVPRLSAAQVVPPRFSEQAVQSGLEFVHFNGMSGELYFAEHMSGGAALADFDRDGDVDVVVVQGQMLGRDKTIADATFPPAYPMPLTPRYYRNDSLPGPDGRAQLRFVDVTSSSGLPAGEYGVGLATGDFDRDGYVDLYITNFGPNQLLRNNGDGTFRDVTTTSGTGDRRWGVSAAFLDYDGDGWLDLYVGNYVDYRVAADKPCASQTGLRDYCGPLAYNPESDRLYHNRGDGTFEDVSRVAGIDSDFGPALGVVTADFDGNGSIDIYVANDQMPNQLWLNQGDGTFMDGALLAGCAVNEMGRPEASMGVVAGDFDGNGFEDLFMAHLNRETNTLYLNDGRGFFQDGSQESGLGMPSFSFTGFGTSLLDYDLDGWLDLFIANGEVKRIEEQLRRGDPLPLHQPNQMFGNLGGGRFIEVTDRAQEVFQQSETSRGVATGDVEGDGDDDLVVVNNSGPLRLMVNETSDDNHWIGVDLESFSARTQVLGTRVTVDREDQIRLVRRVRTDGSYASANESRVRIGLARSDARSIRVEWPHGRLVELRSPPSGRYLVLFGAASEIDR